jgi:cellulose synthase/poly-beta-1,6-N-acetylglucosamine synthase-like glycosyltransferase
VYLGLLVYLIIGWNRLKKPVKIATVFNTKVTVLIAARNEEEVIHLTIEDLLLQDYPKHLTEIIIVDDHSTDRTADIIASYASSGVTLIKLNEQQPLNSYKKKAISEAIAISSGQLMVATDADCRMSKQWLSAIVSYYEREDPVIISAPVAYFQERNLFERIQTLEFYYLIGIGAAYIGNGRASNCNGANLAYRKDIFYEVGGFKGIDDLASGDDEMLLQKIAAIYPERIGFLKQTEAIVYTHAKHTFDELMQQRRRWASKSTRYKDKRVIGMSVGIWLFNLSLLVNALCSLGNIYFFKIFLAQLLLKLLFELAYLMPIASFFKRRTLVALLVLLTFIHSIYFVYVGFMGRTSKYNWKGRTVQ